MTAQTVHLAYIDTAKELTLLLIHGFPLNSTQWWPQINGLETAARVIAPDLRGFGQSQVTPGPYSMALLADDCAALLDAAGVREPVVPVGLSMGGYIAFEFLRRYPERVAGLILTATRAAADAPAVREGRDATIRQVQAEGTAALIDGMLPRLLADVTLQQNSELVEAVRAMMAAASVDGVIGALYAMRDRPDSTQMLPVIEVPTLIIHGAEDKIVPLDEARAMQASIPNAALEILPRAGHLPNLEQPQRWNAAALHFLEHLRAELRGDAG